MAFKQNDGVQDKGLLINAKRMTSEHQAASKESQKIERIYNKARRLVSKEDKRGENYVSVPIYSANPIFGPITLPNWTKTVAAGVRKRLKHDGLDVIIYKNRSQPPKITLQITWLKDQMKH